MNEIITRKQIQCDVIRILKNNGHKTYRPKELAKQLGYNDNKVYRLFRNVLAEMGEQKMIAQVKGGRFTYKPRSTKREGILEVNPRGFGFVPVEGLDQDLYIHASNMGTALDGDLVLVGLAAPSRDERRREGEVLEVIERRRQKAVGTFQAMAQYAFVVPDDKRLIHDIFVPHSAFGGAENGDKVVVSIDRFSHHKATPEGRILQVLGSADDPGVRVLSLAMSLDVRSGFSPEAIEEAQQIPSSIPCDEIDRRLDLRDKPVFTIDPEDANDYDDAVHILPLKHGGYELGIHIADVSYYVNAGTALDREAYERGTSVYLVDRVIPMLPEKLSNKVCSLHPDEDKLTYSVLMEVSRDGTVKSYSLRETVINSKYRLCYEEAQQFIDGDHVDHPCADHIITAADLARMLTKKRNLAGSIDFDIPEIKVVLDEVGTPVEIKRRERLEAHRLIEELMLLANRIIATDIAKAAQVKPFVFRIHERPDEEKISQLSAYVRAFGFRLDLTGETIDSKKFNTLLDKVKGSPQAPVIEQAALRSMAKARYTPANVGHFGLAFDHYTHFTSPIRRYPDLMVHRLLKAYRAGLPAVNVESLKEQCDHCSQRERIAVEAERESVKLKQVEYAQNHLGEPFTGVVCGVTKFGVYVELSDLLVEGLVHVRDLDDDYYEYDERSYSLIGKYAGRTYRLGDPVKVIIVGTDLEAREVDLFFVD